MPVFDSDVIIDALKGVEKARQLLLKHNKVYISSITRAEVYFGMRTEERYRTTALLDSFEEIPVDKAVVELAYDLKESAKGYVMSLSDGLICATAIMLKDFIVTRNQKYFPSRSVKTFKPRY